VTNCSRCGCREAGGVSAWLCHKRKDVLGGKKRREREREREILNI
jgi:hypothetical protein